jgi:hypothetical protein
MFRSCTNFADAASIWRQSLVAACALCLFVSASTRVALGATASKQQSFASPEAGVQALIEALSAGDTPALLQVLGPEARPLIETGDPVADRQGRERFVKSYEEAHTLVQSGDTKVVLQTGKDAWPLPIPLVKGSAGWRFDTKAGKEEILNRRIGRNELDVIQVCLAYVDAQREYYMRNPQGKALLQYAQKFVSTKGKHDGLYWETDSAEPPSPLVRRGPGQKEGYKGGGGKSVPYHGYYYKLLRRQGPNAPDGAYDYVVRGKMIGGFALAAYPAQYRSSGIMTFIVNHDGVVYQKDFGPNTASRAQSMTTFDPDKTWKKLQPVEP